MKKGKFKLADKLGSGGFGVVYRGISTKDGRAYAIKILESPQNEEALQRFRREVRIQSQLKHPNIVPIIDFDLDNPNPWFAMPLAKASLRDRLPIKTEEESIRIFKQILAGVQFAHASGVIHRDLKPENVLFLGSEIVSITDFGLGTRIGSNTMTITRTGMGLGTLEYMAPEQYIAPKNVTKCADIFALGKILYELLTGKLPYPTVELELLPGKYQYVAGRCIKNDPTQRFQSVRRLTAELELIFATEDFEKPQEKATRILKDILGLNPAIQQDMDKLDELLHHEINDSTCLEQILPRIPIPTLRVYGNLHRQTLKVLIERYDQCVSGALSFSYTDLVADFYRACYQIVSDLEIHRIILKRLLIMGFSHSRFHVRDTFGVLIESATEPGEVMTVLEVLQSNEDATLWMTEKIRGQNIVKKIRLYLEKLRRSKEK